LEIRSAPTGFAAFAANDKKESNRNNLCCNAADTLREYIARPSKLANLSQLVLPAWGNAI
jgi:hypothetical protein